MLNLAYAMGSPAGGGQGGTQGMFGFFIPILLFFAIFYFLVLRPQQKKAKTHKTFLDNLKKGETIVTSGGLYGKITGVTDEAVTIEIAEKVRVKVSKGSVVEYAKGEQA